MEIRCEYRPLSENLDVAASDDGYDPIKEFVGKGSDTSIHQSADGQAGMTGGAVPKGQSFCPLVYPLSDGIWAVPHDRKQELPQRH
jgi:hypothetical protein